jgi:hypothetical protein
MSIFSETFGLLGQTGVSPRRVQLIVTDSLAAVTGAGYLTEQGLVPNTIYPTDIVDCFYNYNVATGIGTYIQLLVTVGSTGLITLASSLGALTKSVTLSATQVDGMYAAPVLIIPAPATGFANVPTACQIVTLVSTAFAGGGAAQLQWGSTVHAGGTLALDATTPAAEITAATSQMYTQYGIVTTSVSTIANVNGLGLYFSNVTGPFTGGAGSTVSLTVTYQIVPV